MLTLLHHTTEVYPCQFSLLEALLEVYKNFKRYFATATTQTTQSGCCGTAVRPACFRHSSKVTFCLYTEQMSSILG